MNIILYEPEIPFNTGNIGRTCVTTNTSLHLIKPLGFKINDKYIKRAGLDYWENLDLYYYDDYTDFLNKNKNAIIYMATTKSKNIYTEVSYKNEDFIMFGKESAGIPENILYKNYENTIRIPMDKNSRSLNLSNSVAIILFEALRQNNFKNLSTKGKLNTYNK